jgi:ribosome-binding protein aMBF1 (putative translation factor)
MDGDWSEVKKPVKKARPQQQSGANQPQQFGGKKGKNVLVAGAVRQPGSRYGGPSGAAQQEEVYNHASNVADYDFGDDGNDEEIKFETVSHACAQSVKNARMAAEMTQAILAKKVNEKPSTIVDLENGTARYNADLINRIERALNAKIDRGRKKKKAGGRR